MAMDEGACGERRACKDPAGLRERRLELSVRGRGKKLRGTGGQRKGPELLFIPPTKAYSYPMRYSTFPFHALILIKRWAHRGGDHVS